jgi:hypothetical protein
LPHDKIRDTINRIENLKAANEYISLCLPTWIDDMYFITLYKTTPKNNTIDSELVVQKEEEETDNQMATRKNDNSGHKEKADDTEDKNKWKLENVIPKM